jgi:tripartite-type tricarboxylate transporter receptor subunit TctC
MGRIQKLWALVAGLATAVSIGNAALADKWLSHPISVVSAFATGTTSDTVAQTVLGPAGAQLGQPFVLENRPGHGGACNRWKPLSEAATVPAAKIQPLEFLLMTK